MDLVLRISFQKLAEEGEETEIIFSLFRLSNKEREELKIPFQDIVLQSAAEVREKAPCAYGTNALLYNGNLLTYTWVSKAQLMELRSP